MRAFNSILLALACSTSFYSCAEKTVLPDPKLTEVWEPIPPIVTTNPIPSDAIVLFDGKNLDSWKGHNGPAEWPIKDGYMTIDTNKKGITSKQKFCDIQMHIEWRTPEKVPGQIVQQLGNSGIYLQGRYEVQILDSYENRIYSNGQAGSIYKQSMPLVNASKPPMEWQSFDIIYKAPRFSEQGQLQSKAYITVLHNGVLIQNHTEIQGPTKHKGIAAYEKAHGCAPIYLQQHSSEVSFRNIWVREL